MSTRWASLPTGYQLSDGRSHAVRASTSRQTPATPPRKSHQQRHPARPIPPVDLDSRGRPIVTEYDHQVVLIEWARAQLDTFPGLEWLAASANGGHRRRGVAGKLKASGVCAGFPDLQLTLPRGGYHGLFIELKTPKGTLSPSQRDWLAHLNSHGYLAVAAYGWRQARDELIAYYQLKNDSVDRTNTTTV